MDRQFLLDKRIYVFDLDGTLIDSRLGVTKSLQYALEAFGAREEPENLTRFVGTPLRDIFRDHFGIVDYESAVLKYREYFAETGMYECEVYPGIPEILRGLKNNGKILAIATTKATFYTNAILENLDFMKYFSFVSGDEMDGSLSKHGKRDILRLVLDKLDPERIQSAVMIGDKEYDISAAKELGIDSVGLAYGYGSREEIEGATWIVDSTDELMKLLLGGAI